jgi:gliding motility-associated-like protein
MISIINKYFCTLLFLALPLTMTMNAQNISPQKLVFSKICSGAFNEFDVVFNHTGFPTGTTFEAQLSDKSGSFTNPTVLNTLTTSDVSTNQKRLTIAIPATFQGGENYKLRVRSSTGLASGSFINNAASSSFAVYYKSFEKSFTINKRQSTATLCSGETLVLTVDNPTPSIKTSSPANYPELEYKWYKDNVLISGATSSDLKVSGPGVYFAELDYGSCSDSNFSSNRVTINQVSGLNATISSSLGNPFCSATAKTVLSTEKGNSYQWIKDNVALAGATNQTYETDQGGNYSVEVDFGGCQSKATLNLETISIKGTLNSSSPIRLIQGQSRTIVVNTNSKNPIFSWYKNDILDINALTNTLEVNEEGKYKVKLTDSSCPISDEILFEIMPALQPNGAEIPNMISPNNDGINDVWILPNQYTSGNDVEVTIVSSNGQLMLKTNSYLNNWPETSSTLSATQNIYYYIINSPQESVKKGTITLIK